MRAIFPRLHPGFQSNFPLIHFTQQSGRRLWRFLSRTGIFVPLAFLALMLWRSDFLSPSDFDYDEGINLMKAMLYAQGYALYGEIWNDQPPLLTVSLSWWFPMFGQSVVAGRILIVLLSATLLWSLYTAVRVTTGTLAATVAVILLVVSDYYLRLSSSVMVGLPALAVTTLSVALLMSGRPHLWRTVVSAAVLAIALHVKLMVAVVIPALLVHLLIFDEPADQEYIFPQTRWIRIILWTGVAAGVFALIGIYFRSLRPDMLLVPHFGQQTWQEISFIRSSSTFLPNFYRQHLPYLIVALLGVIGAVHQRDKRILLPLVWFVTTWLALSIHRPLWYHHVTLLTVPLVWLCAFGIDYWAKSFAQSLTASRQPLFVRSGIQLTLALAIIYTFVQFPMPINHRLQEQMIQNRPQFNSVIVEELVVDSATDPGWIFTDRPFYAFLAGIPMPPSTAVISRKRLQAGELSEEDLLEAISTYQPKYVLLERFIPNYGPRFLEQINGRYDLIHDTEAVLYYELPP